MPASYGELLIAGKSLDAEQPIDANAGADGDVSTQARAAKARSFSRLHPIYSEFVLLDPVDESLIYWESTLSPDFADDGYRITDKQRTTLYYSKRITPIWTIIVAIALFPVGLLALTSKQEAFLIVDLDGYGDYTLVTVRGNGLKRTKAWLDAMADTMNGIARDEPTEWGVSEA